MKKCSKCKVEKDIDLFCRYKNKRQSFCKDCSIEYKKEYLKTKEGLISQIYYSQKSCSIKRGHNPPLYSRKELYNYAILKDVFHSIYDQWVDSNYNKWLVPSFDRIDNNIGYSFDNIRIVTWMENRANQSISFRECSLITHVPQKKVSQYSLNGHLIKEHISIAQATRDTGVNNITKCCKGILSTAGGFKWGYA